VSQQLVGKLEKKIAVQQKKIRTLEAYIADNGLEVPADAKGGDDEEEYGVVRYAYAMHAV